VQHWLHLSLDGSVWAWVQPFQQYVAKQCQLCGTTRQQVNAWLLVAVSHSINFSLGSNRVATC